MIKVAIVDDHQLFRKSLFLLINSFKGVQAVSEAANGKVFLEKLYKSDALPHIVLLDIEMPEMDGYETCIILRRDFPDIKILIISQLTTKESIHKILELGAHGYFTKNSDPDQLQHAIKSLQETGYYFGMELGSVIREALLWQNRQNITVEEVDEMDDADDIYDYDDIENEDIDSVGGPSSKKTRKSNGGLSKREVEIIRMACLEMNSVEIARQLCITVKTVESHKKRIVDKTVAKNFVGAIIYALRHEYFSLEDLKLD